MPLEKTFPAQKNGYREVIDQCLDFTHDHQSGIGANRFLFHPAEAIAFNPKILARVNRKLQILQIFPGGIVPGKKTYG